MFVFVSEGTDTRDGLRDVSTVLGVLEFQLSCVAA